MNCFIQKQQPISVICSIPVSYTHLDVYKRQEEGITGLIAADDQDTEDLLSKNADKIAESLGENCALKCTYAEDLDFSQFKKEIIKDEKDSQNSEYAVQTVRLYKIAKSFIESVKELQF